MTEKKKRGLNVAVPFTWILLVFSVLFIAWILLSSVSVRNGTAQRVVCQNNIRQIMLAMMEYEAVHGRLPPAFIADENGKPMHSWRVLLLPYIEAQNLYDLYHFDEPWDGPNNIKLAENILSTYRCLSDSSAETNTSYFVVSGQGTAFPGTDKVKFRDVADGLANTIGIVEVSKAACKQFFGGPVNWMDPRDITPEQFMSMVAKGNSLKPNHSNGINISFLDGSTFFAPFEYITDAKAMTTIAGGEEPGFEK